MQTRPVFLSRAMRVTPRIKIPTLQDVKEAIDVIKTMPVKQNRIDYCDSVGIDYLSIEEYYDTVALLNHLYYLPNPKQFLSPPMAFPNSNPLLQVFINQCFHRFRQQ